MPRSPSPPPSAMPLTPTDERPRLPSIKHLLLAGEMIQQQSAVDELNILNRSRPASLSPPGLQAFPLLPSNTLPERMMQLRIVKPDPDAPIPIGQSDKQVYLRLGRPGYPPPYANPSRAPMFQNPFQPGMHAYVPAPTPHFTFGAPHQQPPLPFAAPPSPPPPAPPALELGLYAVPQFRSLRACAECRRRKVCCATVAGNASCQRCVNKGISCVPQPKPDRRKSVADVGDSSAPGPVRSSTRRFHDAGHPYLDSRFQQGVAVGADTTPFLSRSNTLPIKPIYVNAGRRSSLPNIKTPSSQLGERRGSA